MTRFLLDTHAFLWWLFDAPELSPRARAIISDPEHTLYVSSASGWEIATKYRLGKLSAAQPFATRIAETVQQCGFTELPFNLAHAQKAGLWDVPHRDPFDRMLAAQSYVEQLPMLSKDVMLSHFGIERIWA